MSLLSVRERAPVGLTPGIGNEMNTVSNRIIAAKSFTVAVGLLAFASGSCYSTAGFIEDRSAPDAYPRGVSADASSASQDASQAPETGAQDDASDRGPTLDAAPPKDATPAQDATPPTDATPKNTATGQDGGDQIVNQDASADHGAGGQSGGAAPDAAAVGGASGMVTTPPGTGYALVFSDEFEGASLDRTKWCTRYVYPGGPALQVPDSGCSGPNGAAGTLNYLNDEQERYVDFNTTNETMHVVGGGTLTLRATKTSSDASAPYEAAMIRSKFEFKPTDSASFFVVAKLRLPNVIGTWPSLWLNGGYGTNGSTQWPPEIDIFEGALNGVEDTANMLRMGSQVRGAQTDSQHQEITYSQSFNTTWDDYYSASSLRDTWLDIGAVWTSQSVCYFVNSTNTMCEDYRWSDNSGAPANPASVILDLAIGGAWAGRYGVDDSAFPVALEADYVRVYSFSGSTAPGPLPL